jgi:hypothetical protein
MSVFTMVENKDEVDGVKVEGAEEDVTSNTREARER